jgi:hypothetical protein
MRIARFIAHIPFRIYTEGEQGVDHLTVRLKGSAREDLQVATGARQPTGNRSRKNQICGTTFLPRLPGQVS